MKRCAVVAYPAFDDPERLFVESIRARHDPQAALLPAHFTLVFPAPVDVQIVRTAAERAAATAAFVVELDRTVCHRDTPESPSHVFLLPGAGDRELRKLHERMYSSSVLREFLDIRIPYRSHLTIASSLTTQKAAAIADELNERPLRIAGRIEALTVVSIDAGRLSTVAVVPLSG